MAEKYSLSYTAASLRRAETATLAEAYLNECFGDWDALRKKSVEDDLLMVKQESSRKRLTGELIKRLKNYTPAEMRALAGGVGSEAGNAIVWVGICRTYDIIAKFIVNVAAERWAEGTKSLPEGAYEAFIADESPLHPEIEKLSEQTKARLRSQLYTMMREMGFVDKSYELHPYILPKGCESILGYGDMSFFPTLVGRG